MPRRENGKWRWKRIGHHIALWKKSNEPSQYKHVKQDLLGVTVSQSSNSLYNSGNELCRPLVVVSLVRLIVQ